MLENIKELSQYRKLLGYTGLVYFIWWFAVELLFPNAFNPFLSRLAVVLCVFAVFAASYVSAVVRNHLRILFIVSTWLVTLHYFYLFLGNQGDVNWIVGCYITIIALNLCFNSNAALLTYSVLVFVLSLIMVVLLPELRDSVFLPGVVTIILQANVSLRSRIGTIQNLRESNDRFQLLFNSTFEGVIVHDGQRTLDVNEALLKMLGFTREELIGRDSFEIIHPSERATSIEKMRSGDSTPTETKAVTKDNRVIDIEVRGKDFIYNKRPVRLVTIQNISDRKRAERDRVAALTLAENVRVRDDFISIASHELKTPLTTLQLQVKLIERDLRKDFSKIISPEKMHEVMHLFDRQISRLTELVETMLDVSRISAGRFVLSLQKVDLAVIVREMVGRLPVRIEGSESVIISGDQARLEQVVVNLLTNAQKYGAGNPITVRVHHGSTYAILEVEDQGIGIAPEYLDRIFNRFERAISARNITGFGLGLYITKQIVEAHGGRISVKSQLDKGSLFTVQLPNEASK